MSQEGESATGQDESSQAMDVWCRKRYRQVVDSLGQKVMHKIFTWMYKGGNPIRTFLETLPGYTEELFKNDFFTTQQQQLLEATTNDDLRKFDTSLLFVLLQRVCGLASKDNPVWTRRPGHSLERLLHCLKEEHLSQRNVTQQTFDDDITNLERLLVNIISAAAMQGHRETEVEDLKVSLKKELEFIIQPIDQRQMKEELCEGCRSVYLIKPARWIRGLRIRYKPSQAFPEVMFETPDLRHPEVSYKHVLECKLHSSKQPDVVILTGEGGAGKTSTIKLVMEKWAHNPDAIQGMDNIEVLLYIQCRKTKSSTLDQLLQKALPRTLSSSDLPLEEFRKHILRKKTLVIIDGIDQMGRESQQLVKDVLGIREVKVLMTTRPGMEQVITSLVPNWRNHVSLAVKGLKQDSQHKYVADLVNVLAEESSRDSVKKQLQETLRKLGSPISCPLVLRLIILLYIQESGVSAPKTFTQLYESVRRHLTEKLKGRLCERHITTPEDLCSKFLEKHDDIALETVMKGECHLSDDMVQELRRACDELRLSYEDVIPTYFKKINVRQNLLPVSSVVFIHESFQEYGASKSLARKLLEIDNTATVANRNIIRELLTQMGREDELTTPTYQNILCNLTGLLAVEGREHLVRFSHKIIQLINFPEMAQEFVDADLYLRHLLESQSTSMKAGDNSKPCHHTFLQAVAQKLATHPRWRVTDSFLNLLILLLNVKGQVEVVVEVVAEGGKCSSEVPMFLESMQVLSNSWIQSILQLINKVSCTVRRFVLRFNLDSSSVYLEELGLSCEVQDLDLLHSVLAHSDIKFLDLHLAILGRPHPSTLAALTPNLTRLQVTLTPQKPDVLSDQEVEWCCDLVRHLSPVYHLLALRNTTFSLNGAEKLLEGLASRGLALENDLKLLSQTFSTADQTRLSQNFRRLFRQPVNM